METENIKEFKYLIDSRNLSDAEKKNERALLIKAREERYQLRSETEKKVARLLQLKYKMEAYLDNPMCNETASFPNFLSDYVDTLYEKRKNFAADVSVTPIFLSHIINKHREPKESFLKRLIVHSRDTYKHVCKFDLDLWPKVYYQDKVCNFSTERTKWQKSEEKYVKAMPIKPIK